MHPNVTETCRVHSRAHASLLRRAATSLLVAAASAALIVSQAPAAGHDSPLLRVTLIADSVSDAIPGDTTALATLEQGIDLQLQIAPCRTIAGVSCPYGNGPPPTVLDVVHQLGTQLGTTVIVEGGYNDPADQFADHVSQALQALHDAGVKNIVWLTLRVVPEDSQYTSMNAALRTTAAADPAVTVVDWDAAAAGHDDWFQPDGIHLFGGGAEALAGLLHSTLVTLGVAPKPLLVSTSSLVAAHQHQSYAAALAATGGIAPYRWTCRPGLPAGLHLLASGRLVGIPRGRRRSAAITFTVTDAVGSTGTTRLVVRVR